MGRWDNTKEGEWCKKTGFLLGEEAVKAKWPSFSDSSDANYEALKYKSTDELYFAYYRYGKRGSDAHAFEILIDRTINEYLTKEKPDFHAKLYVACSIFLGEYAANISPSRSRLDEQLQKNKQIGQLNIYISNTRLVNFFDCFTSQDNEIVTKAYELLEYLNKVAGDSIKSYIHKENQESIQILFLLKNVLLGQADIQALVESIRKLNFSVNDSDELTYQVNFVLAMLGESRIGQSTLMSVFLPVEIARKIHARNKNGIAIVSFDHNLQADIKMLLEKNELDEATVIANLESLYLINKNLVRAILKSLTNSQVHFNWLLNHWLDNDLTVEEAEDSFQKIVKESELLLKVEQYLRLIELVLNASNSTVKKIGEEKAKYILSILYKQLDQLSADDTYKIATFFKKYAEKFDKKQEEIVEIYRKSLKKDPELIESLVELFELVPVDTVNDVINALEILIKKPDLIVVKDKVLKLIDLIHSNRMEQTEAYEKQLVHTVWKSNSEKSIEETIRSLNNPSVDLARAQRFVRYIEECVSQSNFKDRVETARYCAQMFSVEEPLEKVFQEIKTADDLVAAIKTLNNILESKLLPKNTSKLFKYTYAAFDELIQKNLIKDINEEWSILIKLQRLYDKCEKDNSFFYEKNVYLIGKYLVANVRHIKPLSEYLKEADIEKTKSIEKLYNLIVSFAVNHIDHFRKVYKGRAEISRDYANKKYNEVGLENTLVNMLPREVPTKPDWFAGFAYYCNGMLLSLYPPNFIITEGKYKARWNFKNAVLMGEEAALPNLMQSYAAEKESPGLQQEVVVALFKAVINNPTKNKIAKQFLEEINKDKYKNRDLGYLINIDTEYYLALATDNLGNLRKLFTKNPLNFRDLSEKIFEWQPDSEDVKKFKEKCVIWLKHFLGRNRLGDFRDNAKAIAESCKNLIEIKYQNKFSLLVDNLQNCSDFSGLRKVLPEIQKYLPKTFVRQQQNKISVWHEMQRLIDDIDGKKPLIDVRLGSESINTLKKEILTRINNKKLLIENKILNEILKVFFDARDYKMIQEGISKMRNHSNYLISSSAEEIDMYVNDYVKTSVDQSSLRVSMRSTMVSFPVVSNDQLSVIKNNWLEILAQHLKGAEENGLYLRYKERLSDANSFEEAMTVFDNIYQDDPKVFSDREELFKKLQQCLKVSVASAPPPSITQSMVSPIPSAPSYVSTSTSTTTTFPNSTSSYRNIAQATTDSDNNPNETRWEKIKGDYAKLRGISESECEKILMQQEKKDNYICPCTHCFMSDPYVVLSQNPDGTIVSRHYDVSAIEAIKSTMKDSISRSPVIAISQDTQYAKLLTDFLDKAEMTIEIYKLKNPNQSHVEELPPVHPSPLVTPAAKPPDESTDDVSGEPQLKVRNNRN